ncbi:MAG: ABC transporter ATP-binding protein, partial [Spirochaetota bacterium]
QVFFEILKEENEKGASILFSSHVLSEVQKICGRVAVLKEGQIIDIQKISDLKENGYKKIQLAVKKAIPDGYFNACNVAEFRQSGSTASFIFHGDVSVLLEKLYRLDVVDVFIAEPSLEEIFLHYYK